MNILEKFNQEILDELSKNISIPDFRPGYEMSVEFYVKGTSGRTQIFKGLCIARRNRGLHSSLTLRKLSVHNVYLICQDCCEVFQNPFSINASSSFSSLSPFLSKNFIPLSQNSLLISYANIK